ncbi:MAG: SGNH/GDSL hydrolase family protein [Flammeovirgaceae bacterium]|jgi:hypothetical protein|nr:SGNH/GDSL hydrolase family protein [Flammeovirgaceae bacterium]
MKKSISILATIALVIATGCEQEINDLKPKEPITGEPGSANFTKFVSVGNSLTAGFQAGALFNEGQANSFPSIMAKQFAFVSENDEFNQPNINSVNGYNSSVSNPGAGLILGRLVLFDPDGATDPDGAGCLVSRSPGPAAANTPATSRTCPTPQNTPAVPAPYNSADLPATFEGDRTKLNNFGVPGILLGQVNNPATGGPSTGNPFFNPLYARFASNPGTSTILGDALATNPTFVSFWLGNNDVLGYATSGASGAIPLTSVATFQSQYSTAINTILNSNANVKMVVATIPDVTAIPFFSTVTWNQIDFTLRGCDFNTNGTDDVQEQINQLNGMTGYGGFNAALNGLAGAGVITQEEADKRKVTFAAGRNGIVINDETLEDLTTALSGINPALAAYGRTRQANANDLITLSAGSILGTCVSNNPALINGVSVPLADQFVLLPSEIQEIKNRTTDFNNHIKSVVTANSSRIALADVNAEFTKIVNGTVRIVDGIPVNATFAPPFGLFSVDGVHPNNRGSAYIAQVFIKAINSAFGATVPLPSIAEYNSTPLPVSPPVATSPAQ